MAADPTFQVSSERDHAKQSYKAQTSLDRLVSCFCLKNLFSAVHISPNYPIFIYTERILIYKKVCEEGTHIIVCIDTVYYLKDIFISSSPTNAEFTI